MVTPTDGVEIVPRLWIGSNKTCDVLRQQLNFVCVNVGAAVHTNDQRCIFIPICGAGIYVDYDALTRIERLLLAQWPNNGSALVHCSKGLTYSPLTMALYLKSRYAISLLVAYQWVLEKQPQAQDMSQLAAPISNNTGWAGA
jgi:hypothetical protein